MLRLQQQLLPSAQAVVGGVTKASFPSPASAAPALSAWLPLNPCTIAWTAAVPASSERPPPSGTGAPAAPAAPPPSSWARKSAFSSSRAAIRWMYSSCCFTHTSAARLSSATSSSVYRSASRKRPSTPWVVACVAFVDAAAAAVEVAAFVVAAMAAPAAAAAATAVGIPLPGVVSTLLPLFLRLRLFRGGSKTADPAAGVGDAAKPGAASSRSALSHSSVPP